MDSNDNRVKGAQLIAIGRVMVANDCSAEASLVEAHDGMRTAILKSVLTEEGFSAEDLADVAYLLDEDLSVIISGS